MVSFNAIQFSPPTSHLCAELFEKSGRERSPDFYLYFAEIDLPVETARVLRANHTLHQSPIVNRIARMAVMTYICDIGRICVKNRRFWRFLSHFEGSWWSFFSLATDTKIYFGGFFIIRRLRFVLLEIFVVYHLCVTTSFVCLMASKTRFCMFFYFFWLTFVKFLEINESRVQNAHFLAQVKEKYLDFMNWRTRSR